MKNSEELYNAKLDLYYYEEYAKRVNKTKEESEYLKKIINYCNKDIEKIYNILINSKDEDGVCSHPLWYLVDVDSEFGVKSYHCKCLKCGKEMIGSKSLFNHMVAFNTLKNGGFKEMKEEFDQVYKEEEKVPTRKLMLDKYKVL